MEELFSIQEQLLEHVSAKQRYLLTEIDWDNRLIAIKGARGSGKTTLLHQYIKFKLPKEAIPLYVSLDNLYFLDNTLVDLAKEFVFQGGTHLFLDEVEPMDIYQNYYKL